MEVETDPLRALILGPFPLAGPSGEGELSGLSFVAKDLFDLAGYRTGAGNPDVLAAAQPATGHAAAVRLLLEAGATCVGKAHTAETAYSLSGVSDHYPTPLNPRDPARDPGGSSSGSAVAVASGLCDFSLGTDTAGSVRVPASYCGLVGVRPTHARVPSEGVFPLAPRFDVVGWLAASGELARLVGRVLLHSGGRRRRLGRLLVAADALASCDPEAAAALSRAVHRVGEVLLRSPEPVELWGPGEAERWAAAFRTLQRADAWATNRHWIEETSPRFGDEIAQRWAEAAAVTAEEVEVAERDAARLTERLWSLLAGGSVLLLPSASGPAPLLAASSEEAAAHRRRLMPLTVITPLARCPEVSLPLAEVEGLPLGLGLVAAPGEDELLLDLAAKLDTLRA